MRRESSSRRQFGAAYVPGKPNVFSNSKTAQDAHEAIRPTNVKLTPEKLKAHLDKDMFALYELIWRRFMASQMARQRLHRQGAEIARETETTLFVARGSKVVFDGFTRVFEVEKSEEERAYLPDMKKGDILQLAPPRREPAFYEPASALLGGDPHKDPRGKGDRPPFHLCGHREHHPGEGLRP